MPDQTPDSWAEIIFRQVCDDRLFIPERPLPRPGEVSITAELQRIRLNLNRLDYSYESEERHA